MCVYIRVCIYISTNSDGFPPPKKKAQTRVHKRFSWMFLLRASKRSKSLSAASSSNLEIVADGSSVHPRVNGMDDLGWFGYIPTPLTVNKMLCFYFYHPGGVLLVRIGDTQTIMMMIVGLKKLIKRYDGDVVMMWFWHRYTYVWYV